ncbi:hypothetical protein J6590_022329 [Homalodisca vitripennis]|nr:hypothetical protein J6590_022329 [Homalodisca vitripennis]
MGAGERRDQLSSNEDIKGSHADDPWLTNSTLHESLPGTQSCRTLVEAKRVVVFIYRTIASRAPSPPDRAWSASSSAFALLFYWTRSRSSNPVLRPRVTDERGLPPPPLTLCCFTELV